MVVMVRVVEGLKACAFEDRSLDLSISYSEKKRGKSYRFPKRR
ncbi:hypothetical protein F383_00565 [Gossypium arboreum]|uniref:Uncharacterized protein n=1 Tax=Gossypium arboreum TaxID=29729 RepID=A0A0B0NB96_GOSAR|nr:hypothetical protein F383_00565 [Gossypium arboreum]